MLDVAANLMGGQSSGSATAPVWRRLNRLWRLFSPVVAVFFFGLALWALRDAFEHYRYRDVLAAFSAIPAASIILALILTLTANVVLALRCP